MQSLSFRSSRLKIQQLGTSASFQGQRRFDRSNSEFAFTEAHMLISRTVGSPSTSTSALPMSRLKVSVSSLPNSPPGWHTEQNGGGINCSLRLLVRTQRGRP